MTGRGDVCGNGMLGRCTVQVYKNIVTKQFHTRLIVPLVDGPPAKLTFLSVAVGFMVRQSSCNVFRDGTVFTEARALEAKFSLG